MSERKPQRQKNRWGVKTALILEELDEKYGILDSEDLEVAA